MFLALNDSGLIIGVKRKLQQYSYWAVTAVQFVFVLPALTLTSNKQPHFNI